MREQEVGYKIDAGNLFCEKNGFEFMYIDEKYLKIHSVTLKEFKLLPQVEIRQIKT